MASLIEQSDIIQRLVKTKLWLKVVIALILGVALGIALGPDVGWVSPRTSKNIIEWLVFPGNLFLRVVKMIVIPLVFSSIIIGIVSSGSAEFLRKIGPSLALYFLITTVIATTLGFLVAYTIQPGKYMEGSAVVPAGTEVENLTTQETVRRSIPEVVVDLLPDNPLSSMVTGDMLGIVIYTIIIGIAILSLKSELKQSLVTLFEAIQEISMIVVKWAMTLVPFAVFGLMSQITAEVGITALKGLGMYILTVVFGLVLLLVVYNLIIYFFTDKAPKSFMRAIRDVQLLAFSTSSSAAVMPLSMKTAEEKLNINPSVSKFLIPVGATINMDGTALYQVVATVFMAQIYGVDLAFSSLLFIVALTVGASIGTPSAPGVGIVILATVLESVGIPLGGIALIIGVDRILDMSRTVANVTGDLTACSFFDKRLKHLFESEAVTKEASATNN